MNKENELLSDLYYQAIDIIDIKGNDYVTEHLGENDSSHFMELADLIFSNYDNLEAVSMEVICDWNSRLEDYLSKFYSGYQSTKRINPMMTGSSVNK